jgi:hypothetical protein
VPKLCSSRVQQHPALAKDVTLAMDQIQQAARDAMADVDGAGLGVHLSPLHAAPVPVQSSLAAVSSPSPPPPPPRRRRLVRARALSDSE